MGGGGGGGGGLFAQPFVQAQIKENIKFPRHWPLWGESTGRRPVDPPRKGPVTRNMFPFDDVIMPHALDYLFTSLVSYKSLQRNTLLMLSTFIKAIALTLWASKKMGGILQTSNIKGIFLKEDICILI